MKDILLIGNGFDLYHGLPTRYSDFMLFAKWWWKFKEKYDRCRSVDKTLPYHVRLNNGGLCEDSLDDFAVHKATFNEDAITYLDEHLKANSWVRYFKGHSSTGENWYDFETEIERALKDVDEYYSAIITLDGTDTKKRSIPIASRTFEYFLRGENEKYKTEMSDFKNAESVDKERLHIHKKKVLSIMKDELDVLNECLRYYLLEFVRKIKIELYSPDIKGLDNINIVNFNYTNIYGSLYEESAIEQHPIHGDIEHGNMVLGISDEAFEKTDEYAYFQKYFQRIQKRTGSLKSEWIKKPDHTSISDRPICVYIFGHSLGKSDDGVLNEIFRSEWVRKIIIYYHSQDAYEKLVFNLVKLLGRKDVIQETDEGRIEFKELSVPKAITS